VGSGPMSGPCAGGARRVGESRSLSDHEYRSARVAAPHETTVRDNGATDRTGAWRTGPRNDRARAAWCVVAGRLRSATGTAESALTSTALLLSYCTPTPLSFVFQPYRSRVQRNTRKLRFQRRRVVPRGSCAFRVCSVSWATENHTAAKQLSSHSTSSPFLTSPRPPPPHQL
jgi:hypothetical protein